MNGKDESTPLLSYGTGVRAPHRFSERGPLGSNEDTVKPRGAILDTPSLQKQAQGLPLSTVVAYILGLLGVAPIVTLPSAIAYCGWIGFVVFILLVCVEVFTAVMLARAWLIMELFWPREALLQRRYPLAALAEKVGGENFRRFVSLLQNLAVFGAAVPFLLLASETLQRLITDLFEVRWSICEWLLVTTALVTPLLCLGTPDDLRVVTWLGLLSMVVVTILTITSLLLETKAERREYVKPPAIPSWTSLAYCYAAITMQFDIHPVMLTVQMDMRHRQQFPKAAVIACSVGCVMILSVAGVVFAIRGSDVTTNLLHTLPGGPVLHSTLGVVVVQVLLCLVLGINTLFQNIESSLNVPNACGWKRVGVRGLVVLAVLATCEIIPHLGPTLELVGALFATPFTFIFPPTFYTVIKYKASGRVSARDVVVAGNLVVLGAVGCVSATVESISGIFNIKTSVQSCLFNRNTTSL